MLKQNFYSEMQPRGMRCRLISCDFGERNTSSSTRSLTAA
jgi:hypothetical protein